MKCFLKEDDFGTNTFMLNSDLLMNQFYFP